MLTKRTMLRGVGIVVAVLAPAGAAAVAQTGPPPLCPAVPPGTACPAPAIGEELRALPELVAKGGALDVTFRLEPRTFCVPVLASASAPWSAQAMTLRTYVYTDPASGQEGCGYPGPTLRLRKAASELPGAQGDALSILLVNNLKPQDPTACDDPCPTGTVCPSDPKDLPSHSECPTQTLPIPPDSPYSTCCCWTRLTQVHPSCMHGDNTTNLHFHGGHVSPQPPADYVLLELHPKLAGGPAGGEAAAATAGTNGTTGTNGTSAADGTHAAHGRGHTAFGQFHYHFGRLPWAQPEGTHWYHPHKHGSVALQVANGMPGAILVEGPFDDWLNGYYAAQGQKLTEKTLVLQLVQETLSLWGQGPSPAAGTTAATTAVLVNGQVAPTITMLPGEVQRWRFLNATPQQALQVTLFFGADASAKQIAMDGVRFARENYERQPLFAPADPTAFSLAPANRADFLVQAPVQPGTYPLRFQTRALSPRAKERFRRIDEALAPGAPLPPLVQLVVAAPAEGAPPKKVATGFPPADRWPPMPDYLQDLPAGGDKLSLVFDMTVDGGGVPVGGDPTTRFSINGKRFDPSCVDIQTKLGGTADWTVTNDAEGGVPHTLHIHINPFQVLSSGGAPYQAPYPWQDTILLPPPPTAPVAPPPAGSNTVTLRQKYLDFTGEYVLHCHYLGHEDQGMMLGIQTVCPQDPTKFGKARPDGAPECVPGNLIPAAPLCVPPPSP